MYDSEVRWLLADANWERVVFCLQYYTPRSRLSALSDNEWQSDHLFLLIPRYRNPFISNGVFISEKALSLFRARHEEHFDLELPKVFKLMYVHPHSQMPLGRMFEDELRSILQKKCHARCIQ